MSERRIPITTPLGEFTVWTNTQGSNPSARLLLLHGGPGATDEYFEGLTASLVAQGIEVIEYDQLGSHRSDQPTDTSLWTLERFVDEVEQVRVALGLDRDDFYLLGHSWGGLLGIEYALAHGQHLKGLIISNMMSSIPEYNRYANDVLMPTMDQDVLARVKELEATGRYTEPEYEELLMEHHYVLHVLRAPADEWPEPVVRSLGHTNQQVYVLMQGPSELGASGLLVEWDRFADLPQIDVPAMVISAEHDTMDPAHMRAMAEALPQGRLLHCPDGSHMAMWDDAEVYAQGVLDFIREVDAEA
jgi:proline iminopeptidase